MPFQPKPRASDTDIAALTIATVLAIVLLLRLYVGPTFWSKTWQLVLAIAA